MSSAWECFHRSMYVLVGPDPQRERLIKAYTTNLLRLGEKDVPAEIRGDFAQLVKTMARDPDRAEGCIVGNTVQAMEDREVAATINAIIRMYDIVTRYQPIAGLRDLHQR